MLEAMRNLALDFLHDTLAGPPDESPETFYRRLREASPGRLSPYLVENVEEDGDAKEKARYYTLSPAADDPEVAVLEVWELKASAAAKLPFNQPSGSQSAALGPLVKRTAAGKAKPAGPTDKIRKTTLGAFRDIGGSPDEWAAYFRSAHECWSRPKLRRGAEVIDAPDGAFAAAVSGIDEKRTVLLAYRDHDGRLPGDVPEYGKYLQSVLAATKYTTGAVPARGGQVCALCGRGATVLPNALRGAGINLGNLDRDGAFAGLDPAAAWKGFGVCVGCADLLYVYCRHVAGTFLTRVAGEDALAVPTLNVADAGRRGYVGAVRAWLAVATNNVTTRERQVLNALAGAEHAVASVTLVWADFGQRIDNVRGVVSDILPSRLKALSHQNEKFGELVSPVFPEVHLEEFDFNLSLSCLRPLFRRPGGKKAQSRNDSRRLFDLRRDIADAVYHARPLPWERFWAEAHETARWHWADACASDRPTYGLLREGWSEKKGEGFLTAAGWVRHLARFLHYCRTIRGDAVTPPAPPYRPGSELLRPYFGPETGIDSPAKAFAFILGLLYGKLIAVQAKRGVNVGANTLTWLRRLTLAGKDLPELYTKVREKMLTYGTEGSRGVRELNSELAELVAHNRDYLDLGEVETCFFLLLGQSLAVKVLPPNKPIPKGRDRSPALYGQRPGDPIE